MDITPNFAAIAEQWVEDAREIATAGPRERQQREALGRLLIKHGWLTQDGRRATGTGTTPSPAEAMPIMRGEIDEKTPARSGRGRGARAARQPSPHRSAPQQTPPEAASLQDVPLVAIHLDGLGLDTSARVTIDGNLVQEYAEAMTEGASFPPVVLFRDPEGYWVGDGHHRCRAARQVGYTMMKAEVRTGDERAAFLYACSANAAHGQRPNALDKHHVVMCLLKDEEWGRWSDREIARRCAVSHPYVGKLRAELDERRAERDALTGNVTSERTFTTKHGTVATMDTTNIGRHGAADEEPTSLDLPLDDASMSSGTAEAEEDFDGDEWDEDEVTVRLGSRAEPPAAPAMVHRVDPLGHPWSTLWQFLRDFDRGAWMAAMCDAWSPEDWRLFHERLDAIEALCPQLRAAALAAGDRPRRTPAPMTDA